MFELIAHCRRRADAFGSRTKRQRQAQRRWRLIAIALELMWEMGCRPGELVQMRGRDVSPDPQQPGRWVYRPPEWKTEHEDADDDTPRTIWLSRRSHALFEEAVLVNRLDGRQHVMAFIEGYDDAERLFPWKSPNPNHARSAFYQAVRDALKAAGMEHITPNQIRHSFATRAVAMNAEGTRVNMGHQNMQTTLGYTDEDGPAVRSLFDQLDQQTSPPPPRGPGDPSPAQAAGGETAPRPAPSGPPRLRLVRD